MKHVVVILFFLGLCSCKVQDNKYENRSVQFGNGGGIAGKEITYQLLGSGALSRKSGLNEEFQKVADIPSGVLNQVFSKIDEVDWSKIDVNKPGNTYRFLKLSDSNESKRLTWSRAEDLPAEMQEVYQSLMALTKLIK